MDYKRQLLNKVPKVTIFFWIIKIMATTVGETAADFLTVNLGWGLTNTTLVMSALLIIFLLFPFRARQYVPWMYWCVVLLISVEGTLITDNLVDNYGVELETTTIVFSIALLAIFLLWYLIERSLSIHSINTIRREVFYWLAILFTFALGTSAGDLIAEGIGFGYLISAFLFALLIAIVAAAHYGRMTNSVLIFWVAYILTRPFGASLGDFLSQPRDEGGAWAGDGCDERILPRNDLGSGHLFDQHEKRRRFDRCNPRVKLLTASHHVLLKEPFLSIGSFFLRGLVIDFGDSLHFFNKKRIYPKTIRIHCRENSEYDLWKGVW